MQRDHPHFDTSQIFLSAIKKNDVELITKLIRYLHNFAYMQAPLSELWTIKTDKEGNSLLLNAINQGNTEILEKLLTEISREKNASHIINRMNFKGDTALHLACEQANLELIVILFMAGANLTLPNNAGFSPLDLILRFEINDQLTFFKKLDKEHKNHLITLYREHLINNPNALDVQKLYLQICSRHSLLKLLIAYHEFNPAALLRDSYHPSLSPFTESAEEHEKKGTFHFIPSEVLNAMPLYIERLLKRPSLQLLQFFEFVLETDHDLKDNYSNHLTNKYRRLEQDRKTIINLIKDIQALMGTLQTRNPVSLIKRRIAIATPILELIGGMIEIIFNSVKYTEYKEKTAYAYSELPYDIHRKVKISNPYYAELKNTSEAYFLGIIFSILISLVLIGITLWLSKKHLWNQETIINKNEWQTILDTLKEEVQYKFQSLEMKEMVEENPTPSFPTDIQVLRNLETEISLLESNQPLSQAIHIFQQVTPLLQTTLNDMTISGHPMSLWAKPHATRKRYRAIDRVNVQLNDEVIISPSLNQGQDLERQPLLKTK